jgi:hypothetical protein
MPAPAGFHGSRLHGRLSFIMAMPNFICVGAERAGTTVLWRLLRQHPDVFIPQRKETHFFTRLYDSESLVYYEGRFFGRYNGQRAIGEVTPEYMRFPEVPARLRAALGSHLKLIFCLRDPIRRAFSQYNLRCRLAEENESFERALELEPQRLHDSPRHGLRFAYVRSSLYSDQIGNFLKVFPMENMHFVIVEEDLVSHRADTVARLFAFLGLSSDVPIRFDVGANSGAVPQVVFVAKGETRSFVARDTGRKITVHGEAIIFLPDNPAAQRIIVQPSEDTKAFFRKLSTNLTVKLSAATAAGLYDRYFREEIARMETLLGRDLSCWRSEWDGTAGRAAGSATASSA